MKLLAAPREMLNTRRSRAGISTAEGWPRVVFTMLTIQQATGLPIQQATALTGHPARRHRSAPSSCFANPRGRGTALQSAIRLCAFWLVGSSGTRDPVEYFMGFWPRARRPGTGGQ
jgi:hypothetical protein